ncbi:histidinol dehydrogenase [Candidatus Margulisiibacteriota bacterium]
MIPISKDYKKHIFELHARNSAQDMSPIYQTLLEIRAEVLRCGDQALKKYSAKFDGIKINTFKIKTEKEEIKAAYNKVPKRYIEALERAKKNIEGYHLKQLPKDWYEQKKDGIEYGVQYKPIDSTGLYVPGGRAPYPSSVLMNAIPARIAGVKNITIATPPLADGGITPEILVAANLCGVENIVKVGGAQAVFALACGTESVPKVDKIVGPGNIYVTTAKQMVYGQVDIDKPAGPSEALIYIQDPKYITYAAAELLAQLEHDPDSVATAISENENLLKEIQSELRKQVQACSRKEIIDQAIKNSMLFLVKDQNEAIDAINQIASEHLVLMIDNPQSILKQINHAGAIFLGPYTPVALGDYYGGTNHVLPTSGTARFASPLGVMDFMKYSSLLYYSKEQLQKAEEDLRILALQESFDAHFNSVKLRLES